MTRKRAPRGGADAPGAAGRNKGPAARRWRPKADRTAFSPGRKGVAPDKTSPEWHKQKAAAERGMPPFREITYAEFVMYDNDRKPGPRPRGVPRFQVGVNWTCAPPALVNLADGRQLTKRVLPLAPKEQARDNWNRRHKRQGRFRFEPEERSVIDALMAQARAEDAKEDGRPRALLGVLRNRLEEGTIRHSQFGLVLWRPDGAGGWLPDLVVMRAFPAAEPLATRDPETGEERPWLSMRPGRGEAVFAYADHFGLDFHAYLRRPWLDALVVENLRKKEGAA